MDIHWNIALLFVLLYWFINDLQYDSHINTINNDQTLTDPQKEKIINKRYNVYILYCIIFVAIVIFANGLYVNKKVGQYGGGQFNPVNYLFY